SLLARSSPRPVRPRTRWWEGMPSPTATTAPGRSVREASPGTWRPWRRSWPPRSAGGSAAPPSSSTGDISPVEAARESPRGEDAVRITSVECHVLLDPDYDIGATSSAQDDIVVEIHTDEGISGVGVTEMLLGSDPMDVEGIWERLYVGSAMNGRRGVVVNAIGAIDMALHDLRGKALGRPCHELLGGAVKDAVTPYASLQPEVSSFEAYRDSLVAWAIDAKNRGFTAVKAEVILRGPYAHKGLLCPDHRATEVVAAVRDALGGEFTLMVDVGYAWDNAEVALATLGDWGPFGLFFVETPVASDDLEGL